MKFLLFLLIPLSLFASKILSYNIYDRTDRVDVMITFDTPYEGRIKQSIAESKIIIKLEDSLIESSKLKQLSSNFLHSLSIMPMSGYTQVVAHVPPSIVFKASKTSDAYGLRLRFTSDVKKDTQNPTSQNPLSSFSTKPNTDMSQSYFIVITVLIIGIGLLFYLRQKVIPKSKSDKANTWLFKDNKENNLAKKSNNLTDENVTIRFQKLINSENSVVMLDFGELSYLVLMGKSNIILDKFTGNKPTSQEGFEQILQSRHEQLDEFLKVENKEENPLHAYKERAASISYEA